jgi:hypothetical protein
MTNLFIWNCLIISTIACILYCDLKMRKGSKWYVALLSLSVVTFAISVYYIFANSTDTMSAKYVIPTALVIGLILEIIRWYPNGKAKVDVKK